MDHNGNSITKSLDDGSVLAPAQYFKSEPSTGVYREITDSSTTAMAFTKRGTKRFRITDTGVDVTGVLTADSIVPSGISLLSDGSATSPSLAFSSSTSSGTYWDTAGTAGQAWSASGTKKMKLTPTSLTVDTDVTCGTNSMTAGAMTCSSLTSSSTVKGTIGTESAPTFSWGGHTTSGMYWDTSTLGPALSRQGSQVLSFGSNSALFSTTIQVPNGASTVPSIAFSSEPQLGFRYNGTGTFEVCNNNNDIFEFSDSKGFNTFGRDINTGTGSISGSTFAPTVVRTFDGSFSGPTHSFQNETTMGMYRSAADVLALTNGTGTTPSLTCDSTGTTVRGTVSSQGLSCGTFPISGGNLNLQGSMTSLGSISCGVNPMTCGALSSVSISSGTGTIGQLSTGPITAGGTVSSGTNSMTCGSLNSGAITSSGTISCGTNALTCGAITSSGVIQTTSWIGNSSGTGFGGILFLRPLTVITTDTINNNTQSGRLYLLGSIVADRKLTLTGAPSGGHLTFATIAATNTNNWTVVGNVNIIVRAYASDGTAVTYTPSTSYTNIIFNSASLPGDTVSLVYSGTTAWYAEVRVANHTAVTFS